ncbi:MAG TPA: polyprenyl synthetase family protein [Gemmatimonadaceae bacterium]|jgi:octaprenyl-diphosphate synthase|nr:polyprenyl synthetase family protein [Gemmatimonadaceae bacterium]
MTSLALSAHQSGRVSDALLSVQSSIKDWLAEVTTEMVHIITSDAPLLAQVGRHLITMKGKQFRPTLVLLSSAVDDTPTDRAIAMAAIVELIHLATLVHDDAVDHSVLRRGMPTINALFSHQIAVIMGDFLYSVALTRLAKLEDLAALHVLVDASTQMTIGEMRQLSTLEPLAFSEEDYEFLIRSKTASFMSAACQVGSMCGASRHREALARYGDALGMAFQIIDDLIDYTEATETTGKPTGLDLQEHKVTLPLIAALRTMSPAARRRVEAFFASDTPDEAGVAEMVEIVTEAGGLEYARRRGEEFASQAEAALAPLPPSVAREALLSSITYVMERNA